jgi:hypothetical protein
VSSAGRVWGETVTEELVWHVVKEFTAKIGVSKLAPHDLRRYAESRIMPNPSRCGQACRGLDAARCGIVLGIPVLRIGKDKPIWLDRAPPRKTEHVSRNYGRRTPCPCGQNGASVSEPGEGVLFSFREDPPNGGLCRIILDLNVDQRPIPRDSGPNGRLDSA